VLLLLAVAISLPGAGQTRILERLPVDPAFDLVIALRNATENPAWWGDNTDLGVFLQQRDNPSKLYRLAVTPGKGDCFAHVERATATDVIVSCTPEKGMLGPNRKFVFDIRSKALKKQYDYDPFPLRTQTVKDGRAVLTGETIAIDYVPGREPPFRVLQTRPTGLPAQKRNPHKIPQSTYVEFARARPDRVKNGYTKASTHIEEVMGPRQNFEGALWFGKVFYDGEGTTGFGGFGYIDSTGKATIFSPKEIVDWSVTAILVEPGEVWLGLADNGEYGSTPAGLLRFDRQTQSVQKFNLPEIVNAIARLGKQLVMATDLGVAIVEDGHVRRFLIDPTTDGRLRVSEALSLR